MSQEMCYIIGGIILAVGGFLFYKYRSKFIVDWKSKLPLIAKVLNSEVKEGSKEDFVYKDLVVKNRDRVSFIIEGRYLDREITVTYREYYDSASGRSVKSINFMTPSNKKYERPKKFARYYPTPTEYTYIDTYIVRFNFPPFWDKNYSTNWDEAQIRRAFDELIKAAQVVELEKPFYVSKAKFRLN